MMAPSHALVGMMTHLAIYPLPADQVCTAMVGAILADIDIKGSWAGQTAGPVGSFVRVFTGGHRKYTHRFWSPLVVGVPAWLFVSHEFGYSLVAGYYSHLLADKIYDTDGWLEHLIRYMIWPVIFACIVYRTVN